MTDTLIKVGIFSPGDMGSATGKVLHDNGLQVFGVLTGRSQLTRDRAAQCGFQDAGDLDTLVREVDLILSILVPSEATGIARDVAAAMRRTGAHPAYADCNAIAPATVEAIERDIRAAGAEFIDAGIIGGPPGGRGRTNFHYSGPNTAIFGALGQHGLSVNNVGPKIGQASGLKMVYAASNKGTIALWTELLVAARSMGLEDQLRTELEGSVTAKAQFSAIPMMPHRSRRWVGEMEEIAATFQALGMTPKIFEGAADMYRFVGETRLADQTPVEPNPPLEVILEGLSNHLSE